MCVRLLRSRRVLPRSHAQAELSSQALHEDVVHAQQCAAVYEAHEPPEVES